MITLPICELTGLLNDTIPFALDDPEFPDLNCLRITWDGQLLHTQAHDGTHAAWASWSPDDDPDGETQESLLEPYGGDDQPWDVTVKLVDAKATVKMHKVDKKQMFAPIQIGVDDTGNLRIVRNRQPGLMAITTTIEGQQVTFPDLAEVLAKHDRADAVRNIAFTAAQLAHFGQVRPRGPMEVTFTGGRGPALVRIGERFTGLITPVRTRAEQGLKAVA